jgi:hypothetical protein
MKCRHCKSELNFELINLGYQPPSNSYLTISDLNKPEVTYPLKVLVCQTCWLVQTEDFINNTEFFSPDYAYFSSTSTSWLLHAKSYVDMIIKKLNLNSNSFVIEIASNDGYLLKNFVDYNIPCLGIEPTDSTAAASEILGIQVIREFFGLELVNTLKNKYRTADLIIGNNVYAHVPDINNFTSSIANMLNTEGVVTLEFPHLLKLINLKQFDTIYHEHFSYLSLTSVLEIFKSNGLKIFDVEELNTHGGSLRIYGCKTTANYEISSNVKNILNDEILCGIKSLVFYENFKNDIIKIKNDLLKFLINIKETGKIIVAYGAAAKGNTFLNYAGIQPDLLPVVFDASKSKQNKFMPGSHIPIESPQYISNYNPDYILILPWNLTEEIINLNSDLKQNGVKFIKAIPNLEIL